MGLDLLGWLRGVAPEPWDQLKHIGDKGHFGEYLVAYVTHKVPGCSRTLCNVFIPRDGKAPSEVDVIMIHNTGIYAFESKNFKGVITGNVKQRMWAQTLSSGFHSGFYNPVMQNKTHALAIAQYVREKVPVYSYIVFSNECQLAVDKPVGADYVVLQRNGLISHLERQVTVAPNVLNASDVERIYRRLLPLTALRGVTSEAQGAGSPAQVGKRAGGLKAEATKEGATVRHIKGTVKCPKCGAPMQLRLARKGPRAGKYFYGCSAYPVCKCIINVD